MELAWLEDFVALAELENFSRAADSRHVTQPAFSRRIKSLENWMGVELFERTTHGATLTDVGRQMLGNAQDMTRRLHQMRLDARELAGKQLRTLYFAATHSLSFTFFPGWIRSIEREAPIEGVRLHSDNMRSCEQMLLNGEVQFLLCHHHPDVPPRFASEQFLGKAVGLDVLLPLCAPGQRSVESNDPLDYLGTPRIPGWAGSSTGGSTAHNRSRLCKPCSAPTWRRCCCRWCRKAKAWPGCRVRWLSQK